MEQTSNLNSNIPMKKGLKSLFRPSMHICVFQVGYYDVYMFVNYLYQLLVT
jgi:hypothetical protein